MKHILTGSLMFLLSLTVFCGRPGNTEEIQKKAAATLGALNADMPGTENDTAEMVELGKKLYFEKKLSVNDTISCNSCHRVDEKKGGVDNLATSPGAFGKNGDRNSPTVLNAGYHIAQFWDGRAATLADQAKGPILNPVEMAMPDEAAVIKKLQDLPEYPELFKKAFPEGGMTYDNLAKAIASFERTLKTDDRFNDFVKGDVTALSSDEIKGLELFMETGCIQCHTGPTVGGQMYRKLGFVKPRETKDLGRFNVTKNPEDKNVFKVPSLRNVALTGPYFHDGSMKTLNDAVQQMAEYQLGKDLSEKEIDLIVKFLGSLTDKTR